LSKSRQVEVLAALPAKAPGEMPMDDQAEAASAFVTSDTSARREAADLRLAVLEAPSMIRIIAVILTNWNRS
jgi:hypothetical protein